MLTRSALVFAYGGCTQVPAKKFRRFTTVGEDCKKITPQKFLLNIRMLSYNPLVQFRKGLEGLCIFAKNVHKENPVLCYQYRKSPLLRPALHLWYYVLKKKNKNNKDNGKNVQKLVSVLKSLIKV